MTSWEYLFEEVALQGPEESVLGNAAKGEPEYIEKVFEEAGMSGWEAVTVIPMPGPASRFLAVFKKPRAAK
jgi:hypothetical protein